ncbi:MAG: OmpA family protein, partial [Hydrococcus sp. CSU_1_8]|nr:OmpA family protein [Hydrococcus sp. CSU_1_8]
MQDPHSGVKVAVLWEPYISIARQLGYNVVLSSRDIPAIVDVIVASKQAIESRPEMIHDFLGAYYRRVDLANQDSDLLISQIAQDARISLSDAQRIKEGINFFSSVEAQQWMNDGTLRKRIASTAALLVLNGKLQKRPENFSDLYEPKFVEEAVKNTQALIALVRADNPSLAERLAGSLQPSARQSTTQGFAGEAIGNLQLKGEIQFAINSASLTQTGEKTISNVAKELQEFNPQTVAIRVIGYTSETGDAVFNEGLSERRAQTVVDALKKAGVRLPIVALGKGSSFPLPNIPPQDRRNQRTKNSVRKKVIKSLIYVFKLL